jgi:hypothetical protein
LLQKDITLLQDPLRNIYDKLGGWACSCSEEVKNAKSIQHMDGCWTLFDQKISAETQVI